MRLSELGEFGLIARLTTGLINRADVLVGVGDDAAVLNPGSRQMVATCDAQVEGTHFIRGVATPFQIGHKALAVNLSDLAAMGAEPTWALVSLCLPDSLEVEELDGIYAGMRELATRWHVSLVGGNIAAISGPLVIDVTLLGLVTPGKAILRSGARAGDVLIVTGTLGGAAAGVLTLGAADARTDVSPQMYAQARARMMTPEPRLAESAALSNIGTVHAMIDLSDGLAADLGHLCDASGLGAEIDSHALPVDDVAVALGNAYGRDPLTLALAGGEDYELLCAVAPQDSERTVDAVRSSGGVATVIGVMTQQSGLHLRAPDGSLTALRPVGWDHLRA